MISYSDFQNVDLRVGRVISAERVEGSEKLLKLKVDLGLEIGERQIIAGIGKVYEPETLIGKEIVIVVNLEPKVFTLRSDSGQVVIESQGMLLAANDEGGEPVILTVDYEVPPGVKIS